MVRLTIERGFGIEWIGMVIGLEFKTTELGLWMIGSADFVSRCSFFADTEEAWWLETVRIVSLGLVATRVISSHLSSLMLLYLCPDYPTVTVTVL